MAEGSQWLPEPRCDKGHSLAQKTASGSWFLACKSCQSCGSSLTAGTVRFSCKTCNYHLCTKCRSERAVKMLEEEITLTLYRPSQPGMIPGLLPGSEEDTWQVKIKRGATVGQLKNRVTQLYGLPMFQQCIRRDVDSALLADNEALACNDDGDVLHLTVGLASGSGGLLGALDGELANLAGVVAGAMEDAAKESQAMREKLEREEYTLTCVMPGNGPSKPEQRCQLVVVAAARVSELLDMARLELNCEEQVLTLEFAGDMLPLEAPVYSVGLRSGDTIFVIPQSST
eukprot:TRINITY_DN59254_c0_g1_i1.p1 TRINITY_DN59254_c0_g1~~TRINITY_DN59254_c0_g1_i1.p1  ORF type:complete len:307 (+),score=34.29 TRINITY_DN59254_c0_g1_i1:64-921(+)